MILTLMKNILIEADGGGQIPTIRPSTSLPTFAFSSLKPENCSKKAELCLA
jgi:hypothetical protein